MLKFVEMDENTSFFAQMDQDLGTVILINEFTVAPERHRMVFEGVDSRRRCDEAATRASSPLSCTRVLVEAACS